MDPLLVAILLVRPTGEVALVRSDRVLVGFDAALVAGVDGGAEEVVVLPAAGLLLPAKGEVSGRHDLDKVHEVEGLLCGRLFGVVERVDVVVCPSSRTGVRVLLLHVCDDGVAELGSEAQVVDLVRERVRLVLEVVL